MCDINTIEENYVIIKDKGFIKYSPWCEVTKEEIYNAMLMPGEYKEKNGKFYVKRGMLDGYIE